MSPRRTQRPPRPSRWWATLLLATALVAGVACGESADERRLDIEVHEPPPPADRGARGDGAAETTDPTGDAAAGTEATATEVEATAEAEDAAAREPAGEQ